MRTKKSKTGNKRNFRDYHSSDYGNEEEEDYGQDYEDENDDFGHENHIKESQRPRKSALDSGDSDFSAEDGAFKSSKRKVRKPDSNEEDKVASNEDTYEEEDPFSPEVDLILADKIVEDNPPQATGCKITDLYLLYNSNIFQLRGTSSLNNFSSVCRKVAQRVPCQIYGAILLAREVDVRAAA
jgi:hypothetical protein